MLECLFAVSAAAADPEGLRAIVSKLDLAAAALACGEPDLIARDLRALAALEDHLGQLPRPVPRTEHVLRALSAAACPPARGESLVDVLDVLDARAVRYDHVFVLGVSERSFPQPRTDSPLVGEADRTAWRARGVELDSRSDLTAREMLLFYLAITRAEKSLTLSYLEADGSGQVGSPSSFLQALGAAVGGLDAIPTERIAPGPYIPPDTRIASARDALCAGVAGLLRDDQPEAPRALAWAAKATPHALRAGARGIHAAHRRWLPAEYTRYDGQITDDALLAELRRRYSDRPMFSAAQLDTFGQCPWLYFARYVLRLAPAVEPQRRLEPAARGIFCHNVLFRLMRSLAGEGRSPVVLPDVPDDDLSAALEDAVAAESETVEAQAPPYPALWQIQREQMRRDLAAYLDAAKASKLSAQAVRFELSFGSPLKTDEPHDESSTDEPVAVQTPAGEILLRGRIDRVDRVCFEDIEGLLVVDYKTGRLPGEADVLAGRNLQMPLYAAAVESLLGERCLGGAFHGIGGEGKFERLFAALKASRSKDQPYRLDERYEEHLQATMETVGRFIRRMADGEFHVAPSGPCPSYCPLRQICQYSPVRAQRKGPPPTDDEREESS
jgi:RecB family exonuclease